MPRGHRRTVELPGIRGVRVLLEHPYGRVAEDYHGELIDPAMIREGAVCRGVWPPPNLLRPQGFEVRWIGSADDGAREFPIAPVTLNSALLTARLRVR